MKISKLEKSNSEQKIIFSTPKHYEVNFNNVQGLLDVIELLKELNIVMSETHYNSSENQYLFKEINK